MFNNPFAFAAVALIAVGFVIYELFKTEEKPHGCRGSKRPSDPPTKPQSKPDPPTKLQSKLDPPPEHKSKSNPPPEHQSKSNPPLPPKSESSPPSTPPRIECALSPSTNSTEAQNSTNISEGSEDHGNCLRRRKCSKATNSDSFKSATANECGMKKKTASNSFQDEELNKLSNTFYDNIDVKNYKMNVVDKLKEEVSPINIESEEIASFDDNLTNSDSDNDEFEELKAESSINGVSDASASELQKDEVELIYKRNVLENLKSDLKNLNQDVHCKEERQHKNVRRDEVVSTNSDPLTASGRFVVGLKSNENTRIDMDQKLCKACEESPCEAVAYPCGHCNLCSECAEKFFRLYNKCNLCFSVIEGYQL